jgi:hypothetical protein
VCSTNGALGGEKRYVEMEKEQEREKDGDGIVAKHRKSILLLSVDNRKNGPIFTRPIHLTQT